jgi:hypothetical protein
MHQVAKATNASSCHRCPPSHYTRRANTDLALQALADGVPWSARTYDSEQRQYREQRVEAGPLCRRAFNVLAGLLSHIASSAGAGGDSDDGGGNGANSGDEGGGGGGAGGNGGDAGGNGGGGNGGGGGAGALLWSDAAHGSKWEALLPGTDPRGAKRLVTEFSALALLKAYHDFVPAAAGMLEIGDTVVYACTHLRMPGHGRGGACSCGTERYRGQRPVAAAVAAAATGGGVRALPVPTAEDVLVVMVPGANIAAPHPAQLEHCRLLYFFRHTSKQDGVPPMVCVAVRQFKPVLDGGRRGAHLRDDMSECYVYQLEVLVRIVPAMNIVRHAHLYHLCHFTGDARCRTVTERGKLRWQHWTGGAAGLGQYLLNHRVYYTHNT